jgi:hypothetical protein
MESKVRQGRGPNQRDGGSRAGMSRPAARDHEPLFSANLCSYTPLGVGDSRRHPTPCPPHPPGRAPAPHRHRRAKPGSSPTFRASARRFACSLATGSPPDSATWSASPARPCGSPRYRTESGERKPSGSSRFRSVFAGRPRHGAFGRTDRHTRNDEGLPAPFSPVCCAAT